MKLKSFNYFIGLLIISFFLPLFGEEKIDIWKNKNKTDIGSSQKSEKKKMDYRKNLACNLPSL